MPDWLLAIVVALVGLGSGLAGTLLRLSHDRATELRSRMLEAADDFVDAYTTARDATTAASGNVRTLKAFGGEDVPDQLREQWQNERDTAITAARAASDALGRRRARIRLLFGVDSLAARSAFSAYASLTMVTYSLDLAQDDDEPTRASEQEQLRQADRAIDDFGGRAREAILASPWTPVATRARKLRTRLPQLRQRSG
jgi:hypothetical protein